MKIPVRNYHHIQYCSFLQIFEGLVLSNLKVKIFSLSQKKIKATFSLQSVKNNSNYF